MAGSKVDEFAEDAQRLLYGLVRNYEQCDKLCVAQYGVTAAQGYALLALPEDGSINMNKLSEIMGLAGSTMTRMVDQLVRKGLAHRRPGDEDRREVLVELTDEGRRTRVGLAEAQTQAVQEVLGDVTKDEQRSIIAVLKRLNQAMKKAAGVCCG